MIACGCQDFTNCPHNNAKQAIKERDDYSQMAQGLMAQAAAQAGVGQEQAFPHWSSSAPYSPFELAKKRINARIDELNRQRNNYLAYQADRVKENDHHGAWDVAINLSETECEIAGLKFALEAMT